MYGVLLRPAVCVHIFPLFTISNQVELVPSTPRSLLHPHCDDGSVGRQLKDHSSPALFQRCGRDLPRRPVEAHTRQKVLNALGTCELPLPRQHVAGAGGCWVS
eukprot:COSAG02_NODE_1137_length_14313_cov_6.111369_11_plen_103_part_00